MAERDHRLFFMDIRNCCEKIVDCSKVLSCEDFLRPP